MWNRFDPVTISPHIRVNPCPSVVKISLEASLKFEVLDLEFSARHFAVSSAFFTAAITCR